MHEKRFHRDLSTLRDPQRVSRLQVPQVVDLSLAGLNEAASVADIGTGTGLFGQEFASRGLALSGLDANPEALARAQEFIPGGVFRQGIAESLPFNDQQFDLVFFGLVLHEADDTLAALREAHRVASQRVAILEWPYEESDFGPPLAHRLSPAFIQDLAQQAGFRQVDPVHLDRLVLYRLEV